MTYVLDASAAFEYLLRTPLGERIAPTIDSGTLMAPELLDAEVLAILRRAVLKHGLEPQRALEAIEDLRDWGVERLSHADLLREAWSFRHHATAYDALYLAAASVNGATLVTADGPLSRIPAPGITVLNVRETI